MVYCLVFIRELNKIFLVAMRIGETPVPIPNTMVKTYTADGTALETVWESRWPPVFEKSLAGDLIIKRFLLSNG